MEFLRCFRALKLTCSWQAGKGKSLITTRDVGKGEALQRFVGNHVVGYKNVPESERCHAILIDTAADKWLVSTTDARFANHACTPNSAVDDDMQIVALVDIAKGSEMCDQTMAGFQLLTLCCSTFCSTFRYNECTAEEAKQTWFWDEAW